MQKENISVAEKFTFVGTASLTNNLEFEGKLLHVLIS
jgi:hypothetical protein